MIEVEELRFAYSRESEDLIDGLSHRFLEGMVSVVTGASGAGKSTLLYLLGLMLTPNSGSIRIDGLEVSGLSDGDRSRLRAARIGFVFQDAALDTKRSVLDNVAEGALYAGMSPRIARQRAAQLLGDFGVGLRADAKPGQVSGGQAQRVALCRALVKAPSVILADEPTGNLDRVSADLVWSSLQHAASAGATVVVATHDEELVGRSDSSLALS